MSESSTRSTGQQALESFGVTSHEPSHEPTDDTEAETRDEADSPPELAAYWPERIEEDKLWYSEYVAEGERFYLPHADHVYEITNLNDSRTVFSMVPCAISNTAGADFQDPQDGEEAYVNNICALAGALEAGDVIHLGESRLRTVGETTFVTFGTVTLGFGAVVDARSLLKSFDPPNGPETEDIAKLTPVLSETSAEAALYAPRSVLSESRPNPPTTTQRNTWASQAAQNVETHFVPVQPYSKWTFSDDKIREWVESKFKPGETILNACCGKTKLTPPPGGEILRNDVNPDRDADFHVDVAELATVDELEAKSIDRIIYDPPWSLYQSNLRYESNHVFTKEGVDDIDLSELPFETPSPTEKTQIGHSRLAKENFDWLLKPGGEIMELTFHGTVMPQRMGYERIERVVFDPYGEAKAVIGGIDKKVSRGFDDFF